MVIEIEKVSAIDLMINCEDSLVPSMLCLSQVYMCNGRKGVKASQHAIGERRQLGSWPDAVAVQWTNQRVPCGIQVLGDDVSI